MKEGGICTGSRLSAPCLVGDMSVQGTVCESAKEWRRNLGSRNERRNGLY